VVTGKAIAKEKMTNEQAKQVLQLYRPGTADATDPAFAEALAACEHDAELKQWFANHCGLYAAIRSKFKKIPVPDALKEQIIAERPVQRTPVWQKAVLAAGAVAMVALAVIMVVPTIRTPEPHDFAAYRSFMGEFAVRSYAMDTNTTDLDTIRLYLSQQKAIADYVLPENLTKNAKALGCVSTSWQGKTVSMICFQTGIPTDPSHPSDLWLFITDQTVAADAPKSGTPALVADKSIATASWTVGNRTYVLATPRDAQVLSKFLPENVTPRT
jgi:hypothetical protein